MKKLCFLGVALILGVGGAVRAQDAPWIPRGLLGSGANVGQFLETLGASGMGNSPFSNGLGQIVSGWTQQGIQGQDLADRIHWLQAMRADEMAERTRWLDQRRFSRDDLFRDIREDRREIRDDERRLARDREDLRRGLRDRDGRFRDRDIREDRREIREDERRLARDREDLRRDLRDRDDRFRDRDIREDRREIREDERRLARDREDLRRDLRDRDDRFSDRDHQDRGQHRGWDDHQDRGQHRGWDRNDRSRDREDRAMRDHDPRRDRDDRVGSGRKDRDAHGTHDRGPDHNVVSKDDVGKHVGSQGGKPDSHHAVNNVKSGDAKSHTSSNKSDHHSNVPAPKNKGKGK